MRNASWDWILTHNVHDLMDAREVSLPKVFLVHGTLSGRMLQDQSSLDRERYLQNLQLLLAANNSRIVYVSELKQSDWAIPGDVIRSTVDVRQYGGYQGEIQGVVQVSNHLRERGAMMGWRTHRAVCRGLNSLVIGNNGDLPSSRAARDWEDLKDLLRSYRVYLYTPVYPYEDGYNLALLEAMATGMPVATLQHRTSPIQDGVEGIVASTPEDLRERIVDLLSRPQEAVRMGNGARAKVEKEFPLPKFQRAWKSLAQKL